mgnify:CR=1 FL=1
MKGFGRVYFREADLTEKAWYVYTNSDMCFYKSIKTGLYSWAENQNSGIVTELGTLKEVNEFLECIADTLG